MNSEYIIDVFTIKNHNKENPVSELKHKYCVNLNLRKIIKIIIFISAREKSLVDISLVNLSNFQKWFTFQKHPHIPVLDGDYRL